MCITFLFLGDEGCEFPLIIANNRDEDFSRPTLPAGFWDRDPNIISGLDQFPGRENGAWLALSKEGRVAILHNLSQSMDDFNPNGLPRGNFVPDLVTGSTEFDVLVAGLQDKGGQYNGFNVVSLIREQNGVWCGGRYVEMEQHSSPATPIRINKGFHTFGNSPRDRPLKKAIYGVELFEIIIKEEHSKDELVMELLQLLRNDVRCLPDRVLEQVRSGFTREGVEALSSIHVTWKEGEYGTRMSTVILIDRHGGVTYVERTLDDPVEKVCTDRRFEFQLK